MRAQAAPRGTSVRAGSASRACRRGRARTPAPATERSAAARARRASVARCRPMLAHRRVEPLAPVVEVAGHQQRRAARHAAAMKRDRRCTWRTRLPWISPKCATTACSVCALPAHRHVQQAALLEAVVADVVVPDVAERPARQQRVAMLAVARDGVGAVGHVVALGRQEVGLALLGPAEPGALEAPRTRGVWNSRTSCRNTRSASSASTPRPEVVDLQPLARPDAAHALVDVVGGHAQAIDIGLRQRAEARCGRRQAPGTRGARVHRRAAAAAPKRGSCRIASALLGEKQRSAASRHGSHWWRRCSRGFSAHRRARRHREAEHMLGVVRHARRVAMAPDGVDLVDVGAGPSRAARCAAPPASRSRCRFPRPPRARRCRSSGSSTRSFEPVTLCQ